MSKFQSGTRNQSLHGKVEVCTLHMCGGSVSEWGGAQMLVKKL